MGFFLRHGANVAARAFGSAFRRGGPMHFGEYPLNFAASVGFTEAVDLLLTHGAEVNR